MHSALFLPEVDLAAPPTPTGSFGGFWRGSEPGEPPTPASTSEVVKSECHPLPTPSRHRDWARGIRMSGGPVRGVKWGWGAGCGVRPRDGFM